MPESAAITGFGVVSAFGVGRGCFDQGLREGACAARPIETWDASAWKSRIAAEVTGVLGTPGHRSLCRDVGLIYPSHHGRTAGFAALALAEALAQAGLHRTDLGEAGMAFGGCTAGTREAEPDLLLAADDEGFWQGVSAAHLLAVPVAGTLDVLSAACRIRGPTTMVSTACSSAANTIGVGLSWLRSGRVDRVLVGAADSLCRLTHTGFNSLGLVDPDRPRPFDVRRQGMVIGEGAAFFVLERADVARRRGAAVQGWLLGYGQRAEAWHIVQPKPDGTGVAAALRAAIQDCGLEAAEVDYVNAHGTGTPQNDIAETRGHRLTFGERAPRVPLSSTKSQVGHTLGASGAVELAAVLLGMAGGYIPPTSGLEQRDPAIDPELDLVPGRAVTGKIGVALSSSFAFGGNNACLAVSHPDRGPR